MYADQTVFGPKDLKIGRWHVHLSSHRFTVDDPSGGALTIVKNTPDKEIREGFCFLNGKYIGLRNFLKGTGTFFEKDVNLRFNNRITVFLRGTPGASIKIEIKKKDATPPPEITFTAAPQTITLGESSTLTWTTTHANSCIIEPGVGSVALNGSTNVSPAATTTYTITATGLGGTNTANVTVAVNQITLTITSPNNGLTISRPDVMVKGTITNTTGNETGITVNGILAMVHGNQFAANHVPLQEVENTITATATDTQGNTASDSVTVNVEATDNYIKITALPESGVSPLETRLSIEESFSFTASSLTYTDPSAVEFLESSPDEHLVRITGEGFYYFTAEVTDAENYTHTDSVAVVVLDQAQLDQLLKAKWNGMKTALIAGDVEGALNYYQEDTQDKYTAIYNALGSDLPMLAQQMQEISPIYFEESRAKYRIRQDHDVEGQTVTIAYYIYFSKNENGLWKIERY